MSNELRGPDGYDPVNEMISHVLLGLVITILVAAAGLLIWAFSGGGFAHAETQCRWLGKTAWCRPVTLHPRPRPHFHYDVQPVYGHKLVDDVPYVGFTTDLLRDLRCCHALEH